MISPSFLFFFSSVSPEVSPLSLNWKNVDLCLLVRLLLMKTPLQNNLRRGKECVRQSPCPFPTQGQEVCMNTCNWEPQSDPSLPDLNVTIDKPPSLRESLSFLRSARVSFTFSPHISSPPSFPWSSPFFFFFPSRALPWMRFRFLNSVKVQILLQLSFPPLRLLPHFGFETVKKSSGRRDLAFALFVDSPPV